MTSLFLIDPFTIYDLGLNRCNRVLNQTKHVNCCDKRIISVMISKAENVPLATVYVSRLFVSTENRINGRPLNLESSKQVSRRFRRDFPFIKNDNIRTNQGKNISVVVGICLHGDKKRFQWVQWGCWARFCPFHNLWRPYFQGQDHVTKDTLFGIVSIQASNKIIEEKKCLSKLRRWMYLIHV